MILDQEKIGRIKNLLKFKPKGMSISDISHNLKLNRNSVAKYLDLLLISGQVEMQSYGTAKVFTLSHRVPLSAMLSFSSELVLIVDTDLRIIQANENFQNAFRMKREDLIGNTVNEISLPFINDLPLRDIIGDADEKKELVREISYEHDGIISFYHAKLIPTVFEEGTTGITIIFEDITGTKNYEHELEESKTRYRNIVEDQTEFISRFLPDGTHIFVNEAYLRYFGKKREEIENKKFTPDIPDEDRDLVKAHFSSLTPENPVQSINHRTVMPDGEIRWQRWSDRAIFNDKGEVTEYQSVGRDITDRIRAEIKAAEYTRGMEIISDKAMEFLELEETDDIFQNIGEGIIEILPDIIVVVHSYDEQTRQFLTRTVLDAGARQKISLLIGRDPVGMSYIISDRPRSNLMSRKLVKIDSSLYEAINRSLSEKACDEIERVFRISGIYVIGLAWGDQLFGRVSILQKENAGLPGKEIIETFIRQSSIALQKRYAELQNRENEERFRNIAEFSPFPISIVDPAGDILYLNKRFTEVFGYRKEDLVTIADWQNAAYPDPGVREEMEATRLKWLNTSAIGQVMQIQVKAVGRDGTPKDLMIRAVSMSGGGQFIVYEDITERVATEKIRALHASIVDSSDDAIIGETMDGTIISWNLGAERMYGYTADEVLGKSITLLVPGDRKQEFIQYLERLIQGRQIERMETVRKTKDGSFIDVALTVSAIRDGSGNIIGASTIARDITLKKRSEKELLTKEYAIASSVHGIGIADMNGVLTYANPAFLRMFGYKSSEEALNKPIEFFAHDDTIEKSIVADVKKSLNQRGWWIGETRPKNRDGTSFDAQLSAGIVRDPDGSPVCMMATFTDISGRKKLEHELFLNNSAAVSSASGIVIVDLAGNIIYANPAFLRLFGYKNVEDVIYRPIEYFAHGHETILNELIAIKQKTHQMGSWKGEVPVIDRNGRILRTWLTIDRIFDVSNSRTYYALLSFLDITRLKELESLVRATDYKTSEIIEFLPDPTFIIDKEARVVAWNRAMEEFTGVTRDELIGTSGYSRAFSGITRECPLLIDLLDLPAEQLPPGSPEITRIGTSLLCEMACNEREGGGAVTYLVKASSLPGSDGNKIGSIMTFRDITGLKLFEESLQRAHGKSVAMAHEQLEEVSQINLELKAELEKLKNKYEETGIFAAAVTQAMDLFIVLDRSGRIVKSNYAMDMLINGPGGGTLQGTHISHVVASEYRKIVLDSLDEAQKGLNPVIKYSLISHEGRVTVEGAVSLFRNEDGVPSGYLLVQRNRDSSEKHGKTAR